MRVFQLLAPLLLMGVDVADALGDMYLNPGERLSPDMKIITTSSCNGQLLWLTLQKDGNLVYYARNAGGIVSAIWASDTVAQNSADVDAAVMQTDGNFVVYEKGGVAKWDSGTFPNTDGESNFLTVHADETLSVGSLSHPKKWTAGTACIPPPTPMPKPDFPRCYEGVLDRFQFKEAPGFGLENYRCEKECRSKGYPYAGLYQANECYCGHSLTLRRLPDEDCSYGCYRTIYPCGGPGASTVFYVWGGGLLSTSKTKED